MKRALLTAALLAATAAYAQPKPPPAWKQGKPPEMADSKLAPLAGRMTGDAGERDSRSTS